MDMESLQSKFPLDGVVDALKEHAGQFQAFNGAISYRGDKVILYTAHDLSVELQINPDDIIHADQIDDKNVGILNKRLYIRNGAKLIQIAIDRIEVEVGISSCCSSSNGCSRCCRPGGACLCYDFPNGGCSCSSC